MARSKEKFPEKNGERWSYCYMSDPMTCSTHFHVTALELTKLLDARKKVIKGDDSLAHTDFATLMDDVFKEESLEEFAARKYKNENVFSYDEDGKLSVSVLGESLTGGIQEVHQELSTGKRNMKTGVVTRDVRIRFEAEVTNSTPQDRDYFQGSIRKEFVDFNEASDWVNDQVEYLNSVRKTYGYVADVTCREEGCDYRGGGPSHFNYKDSGSSCHYAPNPSPHCTCRACWG